MDIPKTKSILISSGSHKGDLNGMRVSVKMNGWDQETLFG